MYIPIEGFWSYVQTRVGTPHKILRCLKSRGGHHTAQLRVSGQMFKLGWGHRTKFQEEKLSWECHTRGYKLKIDLD